MSKKLFVTERFLEFTVLASSKEEAETYVDSVLEDMFAEFSCTEFFEGDTLSGKVELSDVD